MEGELLSEADVSTPEQARLEPRPIRRGSVIGGLVVLASFAIGVAGASRFFDPSHASAESVMTVETRASAAPGGWKFIRGGHGWVKVGAGLTHRAITTASAGGLTSDIALIADAGVSSVTADIKDPAGNTGVVFRYQNETNYYRVIVSKGLSAVAVQRVVEGDVSTLKSELVVLQTSVRFRIATSGDAIKVFKDGDLWWSTPLEGVSDLDVVGVTGNPAFADSSIYAFSVEF